MKNAKLFILTLILISAIGFMFAQNATVGFSSNNITYTLLNTEYPGGAYPLGTTAAGRWVVQFYKTGSDDVINGLDPITKLPLGDDALLTNLNNNQLVSIATNPAHGWATGSGVIFPPTATAVNGLIGDKVYGRIFNSNAIATATKYIVFNTLYTVTTSTNQTCILQNLVPPGWSAWTLINPVQPTYTVNMTTNPAGNITPATLGPVTDVTTIYGTYTPTPLPAPATGFWTPASLTIDAATVWTADGINWVLNQEFVWTETSPTLYKLYVTGPDNKPVTGPTAALNGTTDYMVQSAVQADLLGNYMIGDADAGYQWNVNPIVVDNTGWTLVTPPKGQIGKSNGAKVQVVYEKTIEFVQNIPATTTYTLTINGPGGTEVTGPNAMVYTLPIAPLTDSDDMVNELTGVYTAAVAPAGYEWVMNPITVSEVDFVGNAATITFVLNEIPPVVTPADPAGFPAGYPSTNYVNNAFVVTGAGVHNLYIPRMPTDTGAMAYYNGMWNLPDGTPDWTWLNVNLSAKAPVQVIVFGPTLPVELSSFSAILTAQNFVKLTWVTESETNMNGYNVYRNETADYAAATHIGYQASTNSSTQHVYTHTDNEVETNNTYYYWLECVDFNGTSTLYGPQYVTVVGNDTPNLPTVTTLNNAYPNPFKSSTTIAVDVKEGENATVTIYNILGQAVMTYRVPAGTHNLNWNGRDSKGNACGSGIYFYKLTSPTMNQTKKMVIVK